MNSLVVQWLKTLPFQDGAPVLSLFGELGSHRLWCLAPKFTKDSHTNTRQSIKCKEVENFILVSFFLARVLSILLLLSKNHLLVWLVFLYSVFNIIDFYSSNFFPSAYFELIYSFFKVKNYVLLDHWFETFPFLKYKLLIL